MNVWENLHEALRAHPGWGEKTSALFVKAAIQLHRGPASLQFWPDATQQAAPLQSFKPYLPVDRVILRIFRALKHPCPRFSNINKKLRVQHTGEEMLVWDDLWFWGFFTQKGKGKSDTTGDESDEGAPDNSVLGWNPGKFWGLLSSPKEKESEVRRLSKRFLTLLE